jgi:hypothetical protein
MSKIWASTIKVPEEINKMCLCEGGVSQNRDKGLITSSVALELYRQSNHRLSGKVVPTSADRGCCLVSATDPNGRIVSFLD